MPNFNFGGGASGMPGFNFPPGGGASTTSEAESSAPQDDNEHGEPKVFEVPQDIDLD